MSSKINCTGNEDVSNQGALPFERILKDTENHHHLAVPSKWDRAERHVRNNDKGTDFTQCK